MPRVLIAGLSARAAAESAARAGFSVTAIDAFADLDVHPSVRAFAVPRDVGGPFSAPVAARAARDIECDASVYLSNFENHPDAVSALAADRPLWGNPPEVLRQVRNPVLLAAAFRERGIPAPAVMMHRDDPNDPHRLHDPNRPDDWLVKPLASGGGRGVRRWTGRRVARTCYLQERIEGVPGSVVFVAAGGRAVPLGVSRQLIGDPAFGADGYRYCGNILASTCDAQFGQTLVEAASAIASIVSDRFGLVGVNGVDFIAADEVPYPIEVNPRWCGSMELVDGAYSLSMFGMHAAACAAGTLPEFDLLQATRQAPGAAGKAIVFARQDVTIGDTRPWLADPTVRDVPHPGERIAAGHPVCTVFAAGPDAAACYAALIRRAERVYAQLAAWLLGSTPSS